MSPSVPAAVFASYLLGESAEHLINAGAEQLLDKVHLRQGSVLQPSFPAPLGLRGITLMRHMAVCLGLIARATQGEAMAAHTAPMSSGTCAANTRRRCGRHHGH